MPQFFFGTWTELDLPEKQPLCICPCSALKVACLSCEKGRQIMDFPLKGPFFVKFMKSHDRNFFTDFKMNLQEAFGDFIMEFDDIPIDQGIHSMVILTCGHIRECWNIYIIFSGIPHAMLFFVSSKSIMPIRKHNMDIVKKLLNQNIADICYGRGKISKEDTFIRRLFPIFSSHYVEGKKSWVYIFEKIKSLPVLMKAFENGSMKGEYSFAHRLHEIVSPVISAEKSETVTRYLRNEKTVKSLLGECDRLIIENLGRGVLEDELRVFHVGADEWLNCKPFEGVCWRDILK